MRVPRPFAIPHVSSSLLLRPPPLPPRSVLARTLRAQSDEDGIKLITAFRKTTGKNSTFRTPGGRSPWSSLWQDDIIGPPPNSHRSQWGHCCLLRSGASAKKEERHREQDSRDRRRKKLKGRGRKEDARDVWELKACAFYMMQGEATNNLRLVADHLPAEEADRSEAGRFMGMNAMVQILGRGWRALRNASSAQK